jgi:hypothetical protein
LSCDSLHGPSRGFRRGDLRNVSEIAAEHAPDCEVYGVLAPEQRLFLFTKGAFGPTAKYQSDCE